MSGDAFGDGGPPGEVPGLPALWRTDRERPASGWAYSPELGDWIAELFIDADSGGLYQLHAAMPDRIPPPVVVRAWCRQYPAFGQVFAAAEKARAERLIEQTVVIADTSPLAAPRVALQIAARARLAETLDRARYGSRPGDAPSGAPALTRDQPTALDVSDAELAALALAGRTDAGPDGGSPP